MYHDGHYAYRTHVQIVLHASFNIYFTLFPKQPPFVPVTYHFTLEQFA